MFIGIGEHASVHMNRFCIVTAQLLCLALLIPVSLSPTPAFSQQEQQDPATILRNADALYNEKSYALAADEYGKWLTLAPADAPNCVEAEYRHMVALGKAERWNEAIAATDTFLADPKREPMDRVRGLVWRAEMYIGRTFPHQGWHIGKQTLRGREFPKVAPEQQPETASLFLEDIQTSQQSYIGAIQIFERLPPAIRNQYRTQEIAALRSAIENFPETPRTNGQVFPPLSAGYDWTIDPAKPIDPEWHTYKRTFYLLARLGNIAKSAGDIDASFWAGSFRAQYIQDHTNEWIRQDRQKFTVLLPYAEQNPAELRLTVAKEFPTHPHAPQLLWQAAQGYNTFYYTNGYWGKWKIRYNPAKAREVARELLERYPEAMVIPDPQKSYDQPDPKKESAAVLAKTLIGQIEERSFFFGGSYPVLLGRKSSDNWNDRLIQNYGKNPPATCIASPAKPMTFPLDAHNVSEVKIEVYRLDINQLPTRYPELPAPLKDNSSFLNGLPIANQIRYIGDGITLPPGSKKILEFTQKTGVQADFKPTKTMVALPKTLPLGAYIVRAVTSEEPGKASAVFRLVTDLTLVQKTYPREIVSFIANSQTGQPVPGASLTMRAVKGETVISIKGTSDHNGLCHLPLPEKDSVIKSLTALMPGNRYAFISYPEIEDEPVRPYRNSRRASLDTRRASLDIGETKTYIYTDRPVYRPKQTVHFRAVIAQRTQAAQFQPVVGKSVEVNVSGPSYTTVYTARLTTNRFGTIHGEFPLGSGSTLGEYSISISNHDEGYITFKVEEYKRPEFEVSVKPEQEAVHEGENAAAIVTTKYYDGRPMENAVIQYTVEKSRGSSYSRHIQGNIVTGKDGKARIVFPTDAATELSKAGTSYHVQITAMGSDRRSQQAECFIPAVQSSLNIRLQTQSPFGIVRQPLPLLLTAGDAFHLPIHTSGKLTIYRIDFSDERRKWEYTERGEGGDRETHAPNGDVVYSKNIELVGPGTQKRSVLWKPITAGRFRAIWEMTDANHNKITKHRELWVAEDKAPDPKATFGFLYEPLQLILNENSTFHSYKPGDTIRVLVTSAVPGNTFLLTKEGISGMHDPRLIHIPGRSAIITVPITRADAPNFSLAIVGIRDQNMMSAIEKITVPITWQKTMITITGAKKAYRPGEKATFRVRAEDANGNPVAAEVSLGARDAALGAIASDYTPNIYSAFYLLQDSIQTVVAESSINQQPFLIPHVPIDGTERMEYMASGGGFDDLFFETVPREVIPRLRSDFSETAFWFPAVVTDPKTGEATVTVTFPDSLTTWKATARGVTTSVQVGEGKTQFITDKFLTVRLASPRFAIDGDRITLSAIVRNDLATAKFVCARLETGNMITTVSPQQTILVPANAERRIDFPCTVTASGPGKIRVYATTDAESDALEIPLPVLEYGVQKFVASAGSLAQSTAQASIPFTIPQEHKPGSAALLVQLSPHPATAILDALPYLADYPYGSVEQTVSRFLPAVLVARTLKKTGIDFDALQKRAILLQEREAQGAPFGQATPTTSDTDQTGYTYPTGTPGTMKVSELAGELVRTSRASNPIFNPFLLQQMTQEGIDRLRAMQRDSDGFAWWPDSKDVDPYMTAYVVYSLAEAKALGIDQSKPPLADGAKYLARKIASETTIDPNMVMWMLFALSNADSKRFETVKAALAKSYEARESLSPQGLALLALTLQRTGDTARAETICRNLFNTVTIDRENNTARWQHSGLGWHWYENDTETTAWALRAFLAVDSKNEIIPMLVQWLLQHKRGNAWNSTRETAIVVYALAEYMQQTSALAPDMKVTVALGKSIQRKYHITPENVLLFDNRFLVPDALLASGEQTITITKQGTGPLSYSTALQYISTEKQIRESGDQLTVARNYYRTPENTRERVLLREGDTLRSGDLIMVELTVAAKNDYSYVLLEDFKPAGCEPIHLQSGFAWGTNLWATTQLRDTKTAFFIDSLPQGRHLLTYTLRAETPAYSTPYPQMPTPYTHQKSVPYPIPPRYTSQTKNKHRR